VIPYGKLAHVPLFVTAAASVRRLTFQKYPVSVSLLMVGAQLMNFRVLSPKVFPGFKI
jgi:hypothetical protein